MKISKGTRLLILGVVLVVIDQVIKYLVKTNMSLGEQFNVIGSWFRILFVENEGMAFGWALGGAIGKYILTTFRIVLCSGLIWYISGLLRKKETPVGVLVGLTLITAGAFGNIVDCLFYGLCFDASTVNSVASFGGHYAPFMLGKVVDMFYFPIIDTTWPSWMPFIGGTPFTFFDPVFNFADSCVTVGAFYLALFQWKYFSASDKDKMDKTK